MSPENVLILKTMTIVASAMVAAFAGYQLNRGERGLCAAMLAMALVLSLAAVR